jgi:DNA topoisomerase-3
VDCSVTSSATERQAIDGQTDYRTGDYRENGLIKGFKNRDATVFDASLAFDGQFNVTFVFLKRKQTEEVKRKSLYCHESFIIDRFIIEILC